MGTERQASHWLDFVGGAWMREETEDESEARLSGLRGGRGGGRGRGREGGGGEGGRDGGGRLETQRGVGEK